MFSLVNTVLPLHPSFFFPPYQECLYLNIIIIIIMCRVVWFKSVKWHSGGGAVVHKVQGQRLHTQVLASTSTGWECFWPCACLRVVDQHLDVEFVEPSFIRGLLYMYVQYGTVCLPQAILFPAYRVYRDLFFSPNLTLCSSCALQLNPIVRVWYLNPKFK